MIEIREIKNIKELNTFYDESSDSLHIVKIGAPWCGPCRMLADTLHNLDSDKIGNTLIADVNIDEEDNEEIATKYNIRSIPVTLYVKNGEIIDKNIGAASSNDIYKNIEKYK